jgi:hypothetical protein
LCCSYFSIDAHSDPAIFTVVLAINEKHTLPVKHFPTLSPILESFVAAIIESYVTAKFRDPTCAIFPSKPTANCIEKPSSWPCKLDINGSQPARKNTSLHCVNYGMANKSS